MLAQADFEKISRLVYRHCGINLHEGKQELVQARIAKRLRETGMPDEQAYLAHVLADPDGEEFANLIDAVSTNLTSFFRERNHFHYLVEHHLPGMLERKRKAASSRIRCWSAGCSTGEEPYTLSMVLAEALENDPPRGAAAGGSGARDVKILATDVSRRVLRTAKAGAYEKAKLKDVPGHLIGKYFTPAPADADTFVVGARLRQQVVFNYLNLMDEPWPFQGPMDFIFCRNVMIYFDKATQERLVNRYYDVLADGGVLFTGHSESLTGIKHRFKYAQPTIYLK